MKVLKKSISIFMTVFMIVFCFCNISYADNSDTLTIICRKEDVVLSNMEWKIYYVADILENGEYIVSGDFADYPVSLGDQSVSALQEAAAMYETYTIVDNLVPANHGTTEENGKIIFSNLNTGLYLVIGEPVRIEDFAYIPVPSLIELDDENKDGASWTYDLTALPKLKVLPASNLIKSSYSVTKKWINDNESIRPKYITAVLYRNDVEFSTAILNEENNWQFSWSDLPETAEWKILEKEVPAGYEVTYTNSEDNVTIINTYHQISTDVFPTDKSILTSYINDNSASSSTDYKNNNNTFEKLPQTGMFLWTVPVLSVLGIIIFIVGWFLYKRGKNEK